MSDQGRLNKLSGMVPAQRYSYQDTMPSGGGLWGNTGGPPTDWGPRRWFNPDAVENTPALDSAWTRVLEMVGPARPDIAGNIDQGRFGGRGRGGDLQSWLMQAYQMDQSPENLNALGALAESAGILPPWQRVPRRFRGM